MTRRPRLRRPVAAPVALAGAIASACGGGCFSTPSRPTPPADVELAQANAAARAAFDRGEVAQAEAFYARALDRARTMDDAAAISETAYNAAACLIRLGEAPPADRLLVEAEQDARRAGEETSDIILLRAVAARQGHRPGDAVALAGRVLAAPAGSTNASQRLQAHVLIGLCRLDAGDAPAASAQLAAAQRDEPRADDAGAAAGSAELAGRLAEHAGDQAAAGRAYDRQADLLRRAAIYDAMADALARAGAAYLAANQPAAAADRLFRAARSTAARGEVARARDIARDAAAAADAAGDAPLRERIRSLGGALPPATEPASSRVKAGGEGGWSP